MAGSVVVGLTLVIPFAFARLGPAGAPLKPLAGGVAGAVSGSHEPPQAEPSPAAADRRATVDGRLVPVRATDRTVRGRSPSASPRRSRRSPAIGGRSARAGSRCRSRRSRAARRIKDGKLFHDGIDMASFCGAPVGAAHDGVVLAAGRHFDEHVGWVGSLDALLRGPRHSKKMWDDLPIVVVIDDGNGYRSDLRPLPRGHGEGRAAGEGGPDDRPRGRDRPRVGLPRPLRAVQPARDGDVRRPGRHPQAPEAAAASRSPGSIRSSSCPAATWR